MVSDRGAKPEKGRVILVTGATGAIGKAIARQMAAQPGYEIVLLGRNEAKTRATVAEIMGATGNRDVRYELFKPWPTAGGDPFTF